MDDEYESVLLVIKEAMVYKIPPRQTSKGYKAQEWNVSEFLWSGRLRVITKGRQAYIQLEDKNTGELFAVCPYNIDGSSVEAVLDSSRYFVLRIVDPSSGKHAYIGLGFPERSYSFDFNVALQDHVKRIKAELDPTSSSSNKQQQGPKLDLSLKEGETIKIQMGSLLKSSNKQKESTFQPIAPLLPPPPSHKPNTSSIPAATSFSDDFGDFVDAHQESSKNAPSGWTTF